MNTVLISVAMMGSFVLGFVSSIFFIRYMARRKLKQLQKQVFETLRQMAEAEAKMRTPKPTEPKWN